MPTTTFKIRRRQRLYEMQHGHCFWCRKLTPIDEATLDHIKPRCKGGTYHWRNLVMACRECNQRRGALRASVFARRVGAGPVVHPLDGPQWIQRIAVEARRF